jgi:hypothetical protein
MTTIDKRFIAGLLALFTAGALAQETPADRGKTAFDAQKAQVDRITAAFSDPSKPGRVEISLLNGGITVTGYEGKEVLIEGTSLSKPVFRHSDRGEDERAKGMHRLSASASGIEVEEKNNKMTVQAGTWGNTVNLSLRVPFKTSLKLASVNFGDIKVENVEGDLEIENVNGGITLNNVSGSVMANSVNSDLTVVFDKVDPQKPMSFSSVNGAIDVTFPATVKADVKLKSDMGEIYTDFDTQLAEKTEKTEENDRDRGGKYKIKIDRTFRGQINGGGPEYQFSTFNGNIYIRKK